MKQEIITVGLDLAKNVFQVHAIGRDGTVLVRRKLRRAEVLGFFADLSGLPGRHEGMCIGASLGP